MIAHPQRVTTYLALPTFILPLKKTSHSKSHGQKHPYEASPIQPFLHPPHNTPMFGYNPHYPLLTIHCSPLHKSPPVKPAAPMKSPDLPHTSCLHSAFSKALAQRETKASTITSLRRLFHSTHLMLHQLLAPTNTIDNLAFMTLQEQFDVAHLYNELIEHFQLTHTLQDSMVYIEHRE